MFTAAARSERAVRLATIHLAAGAPRPRLVLVLARMELRRLARHPTFLAPLALFALLGVQAMIHDIHGVLAGPVYVILGLLVGTFLSANVAALRARRDGTEELFGSLPSPATSRTAAQVCSVLGPAALAALAALVPVGLYAAGFVQIRCHGPCTAGLPFFPFFFPLVVAVMGSMGVALGRWIPSPIAAPVVLVAHAATPLLVLMVPWLLLERAAESAATWWGSFAYLFGLTIMWTSLAFWRDRRGLGPVVLAGTGLSLAVAGAIVQAPPGGYL